MALWAASPALWLLGDRWGRVDTLAPLPLLTKSRPVTARFQHFLTQAFSSSFPSPSALDSGKGVCDGQ